MLNLHRQNADTAHTASPYRQRRHLLKLLYISLKFNTAQKYTAKKYGRFKKCYDFNKCPPPIPPYIYMCIAGGVTSDAHIFQKYVGHPLHRQNIERR
jgi:hypothetical protein